MVRVAIGQATVAPFALLIFLNALEQMSTTEFGPQCGSDIDLGVSELPEKKITQPQFAAGADNQIGIEQMPRVKMTRYRILINFQMIKPAIGRRHNHEEAKRVDQST